jgi:lipopolysaccharide transport system permease protein
MLREFWDNRAVLEFLVLRDLLVHYKQTLIGVTWIIVQPVFEMIVLTLVFHRFVGIESGDVPYPLFVFIGILAWSYVAGTISSGTVSLLAASDLLQRSYFPRIFAPLSRALSKLIDFLVGFVILIILLKFYGVEAGGNLLWLPILILLLLLAAVSITLWLAPLHVLFRDIGLLIPYFLRLAMFLTPVVYPISIIPDRFAWLIALNPFTGVIEGLRAVLLGSQPVPIELLSSSFLVTLFTGFTGFLLFRSLESRVVDAL